MVDNVGSYMIGNILISLVASLAAFGALAALGVCRSPCCWPA